MRLPDFRSAFGQLLLAVIVALPVARTLGAQVSVSDTVRLRLRDAGPLRGLVTRLDSAELVVRQLDRGGMSLRVARGAIVGTEVLRGRRKRGWSAVRWSVLVGAGIGATVGVASGATPSGNDVHFTAGQKGIIGGVLGGIGGALGGAILSRLPTDNWIAVDLRP